MSGRPRSRTTTSGSVADASSSAWRPVTATATSFPRARRAVETISAIGGSSSTRSTVTSADREGDTEGGAASGGVTYLDGTAVGPGDGLADGQPQPARARHRPGPERLEDA